MKRLKRYGVLVLPMLFIGVLLSAPSAQEKKETEHPYIGSRKCKKCHLKQWNSWSKTKMAKAFELLKAGVNADPKKKAGLDPDKDYTTDKECIPCHVTGYGKPGGFVDTLQTPDLAGVGCEMCHGPGGTYVQDQYMSTKNKKYKKADLVPLGLVDTVSKIQCEVCHNTKSPFVGDDYVFDFQKRKEEGTHESFPLKYEH